MKTQRLLVFFATILTFFVIDGCKKHVSSPFTVNWTMHDGIRSTDAVINYLDASVSIISKDESATYEISYQVNGREPETIKSLWNGVEKTISSSLRRYTDVGSYAVKGYAYNIANPSEKVEFEEVLWMEYLPAELESVNIISQRDKRPLQKRESLLLGEAGTLELVYSPETTFLPITTEVGDNKVIAIHPNKAQNVAGVYAIPFEVTGKGSTSIRFSTENGRNKNTYEYQVVCTDDIDSELEPLVVSISTPAYVIAGKQTTATVTLVSGSDLREYDIVFLQDGAQVASAKKVMFKNSYTASFRPTEGSHILSVRVSASSNPLIEANASSAYVVGMPTVIISDNVSSPTAMALSNDPGGIEFDYNKKYTISLGGVPADAVSLFSLKSESGVDAITGAGPWTITPKTLGMGNIVIHYDGYEKADYTFRITRYENLSIKLSVEDKYKIVMETSKFGSIDGIMAMCSFTYNFEANPWIFNRSGELESNGYVYEGVKTDSPNIELPNSTTKKTLKDFTETINYYRNHPYEYWTYSDEGYDEWIGITDYAEWNMFLSKVNINIAKSDQKNLSRYIRVTVENNLNKDTLKLMISRPDVHSCDVSVTILQEN